MQGGKANAGRAGAGCSRALCRLLFFFNVMGRNLAPINIRQERKRIIAGKAGLAVLLYGFLSVFLELLPKLISINAGAGFRPVEHLKIYARRDEEHMGRGGCGLRAEGRDYGVPLHRFEVR